MADDHPFVLKAKQALGTDELHHYSYCTNGSYSKGRANNALVRACLVNVLKSVSPSDANSKRVNPIETGQARRAVLRERRLPFSPAFRSR